MRADDRRDGRADPSAAADDRSPMPSRSSARADSPSVPPVGWPARDPFAEQRLDAVANAAARSFPQRRDAEGVRARVRIGEDGVARPMEYRTFDGKPYVQPFWQMLLHLVNHGSYHRGQVTTMLRQLGGQPPRQMDFSAFCRENTAARS